MKAMTNSALVAILASAGVAHGTMTVSYGSFSKYDHDDTKTRGRSTDTVTNNPDPFQAGFFLRSDPSGAFQDAMTKSKAADRWKDKIDFTYDGSLSGNLTITCYDAEFKATPWNKGGSLFAAHYTRGSGDPAASDLFWIQVVDTTLPNGGETIPYPDVYSGANRASGLPFYYAPRETTLDPIAQIYTGTPDIRGGRYTVNGNEYTYDMAFSDWPTRQPEMNGSATWRGELFLASYVPAKGKAKAQVKIYDGVYWGFDVADVTPNIPSPGTLALLGIGGLAASRRRR